MSPRPIRLIILFSALVMAIVPVLGHMFFSSVPEEKVFSHSNSQKRGPASVNETSNGGEVYSAQGLVSSALTVDQYLAPIVKQRPTPRPADWPEKLSFGEPINTTAEHLKSQIQGVWRVRHHCKGYPIHVDLSSIHALQDGVVNRPEIYVFDENQFKVIRPPINSVVASQADEAGQRVLLEKGTFAIERKANSTNIFVFKLENFRPFEVTVRKVKETNEDVVEFNNYITDDSFCDEPVRLVLVRSSSV